MKYYAEAYSYNNRWYVRVHEGIIKYDLSMTAYRDEAEARRWAEWWTKTNNR